MTTVSPCEVCEQHSFVDVANPRHVPLCRCVSCGLMKYKVIPSQEELKEIYSKSYYDSWGLEADAQAVERMKRSTFRDVLKKTAPYIRGTKTRLLDIGCATGFLLMEAQQQGWDPHGIEFSTFAADEAKKRFGADKIVNDVLSTDTFKGKQFQVITMIDLLEHTTHPLDFLAQVDRLLEPGGLIVVGTPDTGSLSAKIFGGHWEHIKREHIFYWSRANIRRMLSSCGFDILRIGVFKKFLNLSYINQQLRVYDLPVISKLIAGAHTALPRFVQTMNLPVVAGDMLVIARKSHAK